MSGIWTIASNDLRVFLKDKAGYIWLFAMPFVFILFFGVTMRVNNGEPSDPRPSVEINNRDAGYFGNVLVELLEAEGLRVVDTTNGETSDRKIEIPRDFTERIENADQVDVGYSQTQESGAQPTAMIEVRINRAIVTLTSAIFSVVAESDEEHLSEERLREFLAKKKHITLATSFAGRRKVPSGFDHSAPANTVMFVLMNSLIFGGLSLASERSNGVLRRIAVHPLHSWQIVIGKILGRFLLGVVQVVFFLIAGGLLGVPYGGNFLFVVLTLLVFAWGCAALGVFVGALVKTPEIVPGICMLIALPMGALGGCWWPLEIVPDFMRKIAFVFPTAWTLHAIHQLVSFGGGFGDIQTSLAVLCFFSALATILAVRFLRVN